jgi:hypothetical protein
MPGLSPALFLFAISGNTAYALSIVAASVDRAYLIANASWIVGAPRAAPAPATPGLLTSYFPRERGHARAGRGRGASRAPRDAGRG